MINTTAHCGCHTVSLEITLSKNKGELIPRRCDCDFCVRHRLVYLSDPNGSVKLLTEKTSVVEFIKQGSETAEFIKCGQCGDIVLVAYLSEDVPYCAVNYQLLVDKIGSGEMVTVSPKKLNPLEKIKRWKKIWFNKLSMPENLTRDRRSSHN